MQFSERSILKICTGEKTQTRRSYKEGDEVVLAMSQTKYPEQGVYQVFRGGRLLWQCGKTYAICPGRGKPQVARFRLLMLRMEDARNISAQDAIAEGFATIGMFLETWCLMKDKGAIPAIKLAKMSGVPPMETLRKRPDSRYNAWALTFELVRGE